MTMTRRYPPNPVDAHVASRMRTRRMTLGMSQEKLAAGLGTTSQQVQSYEKGRNRMGSSRLQQAADILGVTVPFFFEGADSKPYQSNGSEPSPAYIDDFVTTSDGLRLVKRSCECGLPCDGTSLRS
jgi:transcriptional regulator with XRE-family HTH domain